MRVFHETGLVHRDIKCDNILLHCPPGTGHVYAKISDFGFAKKEDLNHEQTQFAGTIPYMSPEQFHKNPVITQKVDIYALGITFYKLITHKYPVNERNFKEQGKKMTKLKCIDRPSEIKDDILQDLLQKMLEFDPNKRITAAQALQHPYFTSPESIADISPEQQNIAEESTYQKKQRYWLTIKYEKIPSYIFPESEIKKFLPKQNSHQKEQSLHLTNSQIETFSNQEKLKDENENEQINKENQFKIQNQNQNQIENKDQNNIQKNIEIISIIKQQFFEKDDIQKINNLGQQYESSSQQQIEVQQQIYQSSSYQLQSSIVQQDEQLLPLNNFSGSIYSHHYRSIGDPTWISQQFLASKEQLKAEKDLNEMNMPLEEIKENLDKFQSLSKLQFGVICTILNKHIQYNIENREIAFQIGIINALIQMNLNLSSQQIYPIYIQPLLSLTEYFNKEDWKQLLQMDILKFVNKLLNCKNELIIVQIIELIKRIVIEFSEDIEEGKPNPLLKELVREEIITKLIEIF